MPEPSREPRQQPSSLNAGGDRQCHDEAEGGLGRKVLRHVPELEGNSHKIVGRAVVSARADAIPAQKLGRTRDVIQGCRKGVGSHSSVHGRWAGVIEVRRRK